MRYQIDNEWRESSKERWTLFSSGMFNSFGLSGTFKSLINRGLMQDLTTDYSFLLLEFVTDCLKQSYIPLRTCHY